MGLDTAVNLLTATLDLQLVRLIRGAIRTADLSSGCGCAPASGLGPAPNCDCCDRRHLEPEPVIEPRRHIYPDPRIEPRRVIHPEPRLEVRLNDAAAAGAGRPALDPVVIEVKQCSLPPSPIQPPWKVLPWQNPPGLPPPPPRKPVLKIILRRPDMMLKGTMIDVFI